jgi:hypothetical protein
MSALVKQSQTKSITKQEELTTNKTQRLKPGSIQKTSVAFNIDGIEQMCVCDGISNRQLRQLVVLGQHTIVVLQASMVDVSVIKVA